MTFYFFGLLFPIYSMEAYGSDLTAGWLNCMMSRRIARLISKVSAVQYRAFGVACN